MRSILIAVLSVFLLPLTGQAQSSWEELYDEAKGLSYTDPGRSIRLLEEAIPKALQELGEEHEAYANLLNDLGLAYWVTGETRKAQALFSESISIKKELYGEDGPDYAASLINMAGVYRELRQFGQSKVMYLEALNILEDYKDDRPGDYASSLNFYGNLLLEIRDENGAYQQFSKALRFSESALGERHRETAASLANLGRLMTLVQRANDAESNLKAALSIYELDKNTYKKEYAGVQQLLGDLYLSLSEYSEAEQNYRAAAEIRKAFTGADREQYAATLNALASLYYAISSYDRAETYYQQSAAIIGEVVGTESDKYATAINNLARFYSNTNKLDKAEQLYLDASEVYLKVFGESHPSYSATINNLAVIYRRRGDLEKALEMYQKVLAADSAALGVNHPVFATTLNNIGTLYMARGSLTLAENAFLRATNIRREQLGENHPDFAKSLDKLALFYFGQGAYDKAEPLFTESILINIRKVKSQFASLSEKEKESFYNSIRNDIEKYNSIVLLQKEEKPGLVATMYDNQLETKAILFNASDKMRNAILNSGNRALIEKFNSWRSLKSELGQYYTIDRNELARRGVDIRDIEERIYQLEKEISAASELFAEETNVVRHSWKEVRGKLEKGQAAVEIIRFREFDFEKGEGGRINFGFTQNVYYVALIVKSDTQENPEIVVFENGRDLEETFQANYKNSLRYKVEDTYSYKAYWEPIAAKLGGIEEIYLSPDGVYNVVNPNIFKDPQTGRYVIDDLDIRFVTNTRDLLEDKKPENTVKSAVLIGNPDYVMEPSQRMEEAGTAAPVGNGGNRSSSIGVEDIPYGKKYFTNLPGARQEIIEIDEITSAKGWKNKTYLGPTAIEEVIKNLYNPKVLHIATHGFFSEDLKAAERELGVSVSNPLFRSGLMLAGAGATIYDRFNGNEIPPGVEDGILTAYEAMNLNLDKTDLVVLSACETGLGEIINGEGVYGLQRAFRVAGADAVLISLFKVDDAATKVLMTCFYEEWLKLGNKQQAFKAAQLKFREEYPEPYFWGSFILSGE